MGAKMELVQPARPPILFPDGSYVYYQWADVQPTVARGREEAFCSRAGMVQIGAAAGAGVGALVGFVVGLIR